MGPGVRADQRLVRHAGQVLPADDLEGECLPDRGFSVRGLLVLVVPDGLPEAVDETGVVAVAVLGDDRRDGVRVAQGEPPADRCAVVLDVHRVAADPEGIEQPGGEIGQCVEGVVELLDRRRVGEPEAEVVRGDHPVAIGQLRNQVAEHERAGGEPVQQHQNGSVGRAGLAVEELVSGDGGVPVVNLRHSSNSFEDVYWLDTEACDRVTCQRKVGG